MYKGKFEAPKGAPRPRRVPATRRIEDVPLNTARSISQQNIAQYNIPQQNTPQQNIPQQNAPQQNAQLPRQASVQQPDSDFLNSFQSISRPVPASAPSEEDMSAIPTGSDKLVPMETLSLRRAGVADAVPQQKAPAQAADTKPKTKKPVKRRSKGTVIFYGIFFTVILLFFGFLAGVLSYLDGWLVNYEKSQPKVKSQETFDQYFAVPDWGQLYDLAGYTDTKYEGKQQFAQYMTEMVGDQELRFVATASGDPLMLSKYLLKAGDARIGTFTLAAQEGSKKIKKWELSNVTLPVTRKEGVTVSVGPGQTVYINGVALTQEHIIRTTVTMAEEYLPEGLHGHSATTYHIDGLLVAPKVEVKDAQGNPVALTYDENLKQYTAEFAKASFTISDRDRETVIAAAKVLSEFRIERKGQDSLSRHFDKNSDYYKATVKQDTWMQTTLYKSHKFSEPVVSEYYVYSDSLFSAHVEMTLYVTRTDGSVKEWDASNTFFFTKRSDGTWIVTDANKIRLQQEVTKVRLMYMLDGEMVTYELVDSTSIQLEPPYVAVPEGKRFAGWYQETVDENGKTVLSLAFMPDETTGLVYLGTGVQLEPMVLHARFENEGAE